MLALRMARATPQRGTLGSIETAQIGPNVVLTTMVGHVTRMLAEDQCAQFGSVLGRLKDPTWIMDQTDLKTFEPSAISAGSRWFDAFRKSGGSRLFLVSRLHAARMAAATIAFGVGLKVQSFDDLRDALDSLGLRPNAAR